jgi:transposase, IS5 family
MRLTPQLCSWTPRKAGGFCRRELIHYLRATAEAEMAGQPGFFDLSDRYEALSAAGDPLERLSAVVDFELFRSPLVAVLRRSPRNKRGRPPFDPVLMFKILVLQALYSLSDEATEFQIKGRLSFQRFLGVGLEGTVPDPTTVWLFRERHRYRPSSPADPHLGCERRQCP